MCDIEMLLLLSSLEAFFHKLCGVSCTQKGTVPVQYIAAHLSKVHGLDWSPTREFSLASSSQDQTVKVLLAQCILIYCC